VGNDERFGTSLVEFQGGAMLYLVAGLLTLFLMLYLFAALLKPEWF
jgi:K+-transporting ATPase KdpF subunit